MSGRKVLTAADFEATIRATWFDLVGRELGDIATALAQRVAEQATEAYGAEVDQLSDTIAWNRRVHEEREVESREQHEAQLAAATAGAADIVRAFAEARKDATPTEKAALTRVAQRIGIRP